MSLASWLSRNVEPWFVVSAESRGVNTAIKVSFLLPMFSQAALKISECYHQAWSRTSVIPVLGTWEAEAGGLLQVQSQPKLQREF